MEVKFGRLEILDVIWSVYVLHYNVNIAAVQKSSRF
jgi:hypothetical protein